MADIKLFNGDCVEVLDTLDKESVNLVITSPPYNVDLGNNKYNNSGYNLYNDNREHKEYIEWLKTIFAKVKTVLKSGGRVCINIGDGKNGTVPTSSDIIQFMCNDLNYIPTAHIIWNKNNIAARTAWGSYMSPSSPSYPCPFEHILIFAKDSTKLLHSGTSDLKKSEFITYANSLWTFTPEKLQEVGHPAAFPMELPYRLIKMNSYIGDTVLDIFMGSGTTGVTCKLLDRNFIGIELDKKYFDMAETRIQRTDKLHGDGLNVKTNSNKLLGLKVKDGKLI
jgi:site-specific DNA-methyltransferase (adenine-specific)